MIPEQTAQTIRQAVRNWGVGVVLAIMESECSDEALRWPQAEAEWRVAARHLHDCALDTAHLHAPEGGDA
jgi:hypothetical protein